jgi:hypothetical protein
MDPLDFVSAKARALIRGGEELQRLMISMAREPSDEANERFFRTLLGGHLIIPVDERAEAAAPDSSRATSVSLQCTKLPDGRVAALAYTTEAAVKAFAVGGCDTLVGPAAEFFREVVETGLHLILLDSHGPARMILDGGVLQALARGEIPGGEGGKVEAVARPVSHKPEPPLSPPDEAASRQVRGLLATDTRIRAAWWVDLVNEYGQRTPALWLLAARGAGLADGPDAQRIQASVAAAVGTEPPMRIANAEVAPEMMARAMATFLEGLGTPLHMRPFVAD